MKMSPVPPAPTATIALTGRLGRFSASSYAGLCCQSALKARIGAIRVFRPVSNGAPSCGGQMLARNSLLSPNESGGTTRF